LLLQVVRSYGSGLLEYVIDGTTYNYYQRFRGISTFDYYGSLAETWTSRQNVLGTDFGMFALNTSGNSTVTISFGSCSFDEEGMGYPGYCGPSAPVYGKWTHFHDATFPNFVKGQQTTEIWCELNLPISSAVRKHMDRIAVRKITTAPSDPFLPIQSLVRINDSFAAYTDPEGVSYGLRLDLYRSSSRAWVEVLKKDDFRVTNNPGQTAVNQVPP
jgi:hypothetical protein